MTLEHLEEMAKLLCIQIYCFYLMKNDIVRHKVNTENAFAETPIYLNSEIDKMIMLC